MFFIHQIGENNNSNRNSFNPLLYRCFRVLRVDEFHGFRYDLKKEQYIAKLKELKQEKRIAYEIDKELERDEMVKESQREKVPDREKRRIKSR